MSAPTATLLRARPGPRLVSLLPTALLVAAVAAAVFWIGYDGGGYGLASRSSVAIVVWWVVLLSVATGWRSLPLSREVLVVGSALAALALWTGLSVVWADSAEKAFNELNRVTLYLGVFALVVVLATRERVRQWSDGLALGTTVVALLALVSRLFPQAFPEGDVPRFLPGASARLSYPVNYWNALAAVAAIAAVLLLGSAVRARHPALRGLALAPIPALACVVYFTSSRGGVLTAVVGITAFLALTARRWAAGAAVVVAGAGAVLAVAIVRSRTELVEGPLGSALAEEQGRGAAVLITLVCLGVGLAYGLGVAFAPPPPRLPRPLALVSLAVAAAVLVAALVAFHPVRRFEDFKRLPESAEDASVGGHIVSTSGNGRWQLWGSAVDQFQTEPLRGGAAGSYEAWWAQHGTIASFVLDAHSLYLETLGELGVVGLALLVVVLGSVIVLGAQRLRRTDGDERVVNAALLAAFVAFLAEAAVDWVWELTAVTAVAVAIAALLTVPSGDRRAPGRRAGATRLPVRVLVPALALVVVLAHAVPMLAAARIRDSQAAIDRGAGDAAARGADLARRIQPWAASPYLQLALVQEERGRLVEARGWVEEALERDRRDWRIWLVTARLNAKTGRPRVARAALRRLRTLNPRSRLFATGSSP